MRLTWITCSVGVRLVVWVLAISLMEPALRPDMAVQDGVRGGPSKRIFAQAIAFLKRRRARRRRGPARELLEARGGAHAGALRARAGGPDDAQAVLQGPGLALAAQCGQCAAHCM